MADDWEEWEDSELPVLPAAGAAAPKPAQEYETKGEAILAMQAEPDMSKFADEDQEEEKPKASKPVAKKPAEKKELKKHVISEADIPLDDPVAEKLRQQRLVEEADLKAARELFGDEEEKHLEDLLPKSLKDFEEYADIMARKYITCHAESKNYKAFLKVLVRLACGPLPSNEIKDIETSVAGVRTDKVKAEALAAAANAKKGQKKSLQYGKGELSAGLDDYVYDDDPNGDDYDFM